MHDNTLNRKQNNKTKQKNAQKMQKVHFSFRKAWGKKHFLKTLKSHSN